MTIKNLAIPHSVQRGDLERERAQRVSVDRLGRAHLSPLISHLIERERERWVGTGRGVDTAGVHVHAVQRCPRGEGDVHMRALSYRTTCVRACVHPMRAS